MKPILSTRMVALFSIILSLSSLLAGCMKPAYPDESEVRYRFQIDYRDANCQLVKIYPAKLQPNDKSQPFIYTHIRFQAKCSDDQGKSVSMVRKQVWQLNRERPSLFQGAWRWTQAGEISDY